MPSPTFDKIGSATVSGSSQPTIEFTNVSADYDSLMIVASLRSVGGGTTDEYGLRFNDDATANYIQNLAYFTGGTRQNTGIFTDSAQKGIQTTASGNTANAFSNTSILIVNYKTTKVKSMIVESTTFNSSAATIYHKFGNGYWNSSATVNKISLTGGSGNFAVYSTATLYGIKNT